MSENPWVVLTATVVIVALSAFFVAVEFAALAAKRHRLEEAAPGSRSARAALRNSSELTLLLAGSQLGITAATLALGAISKPAVHHWLTPLFESWGLPLVAADVAGFVLALLVITFIHLVVGEMAPKSWAIAHPERSATLLAAPMRAFMAVFRPLLRLLNTMANRLVRSVGVEPADELAVGHSPDALRHLVEHSANVGALDAGFSTQISGALELERMTVRELVTPEAPLVSVPADATVEAVREATRRSGHLRILLGTRARLTGVVHVRDTLASAPGTPAAGFARPVFDLDAGTTVWAALAAMRETRNHLAVVTEAGSVLGVVTMADVLHRLLPQPAAAEPAG
ncbi:HlyC/CorC family transporter [Blastococcus sp. MG754426]|uniref:hemolysin family protein n=1 Tax=unclassified Blastococcus TaxID=2619396 RepID=UPI001EF12BD1|nr:MULTISPECIES: hemolysin family protein [unclassified Blastococcus]MCF6506676.1 HlyC/CorC family transporter [Blastococcus sp. MG754426]MCF6511488.1 HlyC/CorC family transporter [Blastococcus sp. MG754427]MCF6734873.1 HlyC/CorC family transporter [Blastococcus sp. KM273129]